ncbi:protein MANBAL [Brachyistius frenatus]|uniref:protein MANBAL n=1 Tax=Brachyistius frenatus TaxID=100188 RepID=UPI0037E7807C
MSILFFFTPLFDSVPHPPVFTYKEKPSTFATGRVSERHRPDRASIMSAELDLSPPEVPEPTLLESILRYGLFLGAIFQLICILAVIFPTSKGHEQEETESTDGKAAEQMKKPKGSAPQIRQKPKKESKKKR